MSKVTVTDEQTQGLTQEQVDECIHENMGTSCPWCGACATAGGLSVEDGSIYQTMRCGSCGRHWQQVAWLVGILPHAFGDNTEWQYATGVEPGPVDYKALAVKLAEACSIAKGRLDYKAENCRNRDWKSADQDAHNTLSVALATYGDAVEPKAEKGGAA